MTTPKITPVRITTSTIKAWVALAFLIVTAITSSNIVPISGTAHTVWSIISIVIGAIATWAAPNNVKTINGEVVDK